MGKNTTVWLDSDKAFIISFNHDEESFLQITSNLEHYHYNEGRGNTIPFLGQEVSSERKLLERKKQQLKRYFKEIITNLLDASQIAIYGPADTKFKFRKELENHRDLNRKIISFKVADKMTKNQLISMARNFYLTTA